MTRHPEALERLRSANPLPGIEHVDADELALFLAEFEQRKSRTTTPNVPNRKRPMSPQPLRRRRLVVAFGLSLITGLAAIGGIVLLANGGAEGPVITQPPVPETTAVPQSTTLPEPASTLAPLPGPPPVVETFTRFEFDGLGPTVGASGPAGFVGFSPVLGSNGYFATGWFSSNGIDWRQINVDATFAPGFIPSSVVYGANGYLVSGWFEADRPFGDGPAVRGPIFGSTDGLTWSRMTEDGLVTDGDMGVATYGTPGYVSLYDDSVADGESDLEYYVAAWFSDDGQTWIRVSHDAEAFGSAGWISVRDVTYGPSGFVAIGADDARGGQDGVVWHSPDGIDWARVPNKNDIFGGPAGPSTWIEMEAIAYGNGTYVIVGVGPPTPTIWVSPDGLNWSLLPNDGGVFGGAEQSLDISDVAFGEQGFLAVGSVLEPRPLFDGSEEQVWLPTAAAAWTSADGLRWTRVPHDDEAFGSSGEMSMHSVVYGNGVFIIEGTESQPAAQEPEAELGRTVIWKAE